MKKPQDKNKTASMLLFWALSVDSIKIMILHPKKVHFFQNFSVTQQSATSGKFWSCQVVEKKKYPQKVLIIYPRSLYFPCNIMNYWIVLLISIFLIIEKQPGQKWKTFLDNFSISFFSTNKVDDIAPKSCTLKIPKK